MNEGVGGVLAFLWELINEGGGGVCPEQMCK